ncbi:AAA family ATPase [uncultured Herbaspirillum sp.]|uniref:AAA family ATPase n=1 Tax=uncultured Herbaspirillum sp. TaxID=160236 RepID=UPI0026259239|nr:AAA family ATPase [uncultured Herbaspirillum sp.]
MYIKKIQIEEGFLNGFEIDLSLGLNVVIGARGTGKTSLIELIRFGLGTVANTPETSRRSRDHALSVLGSGQVTITLADQNNEIVVVRSASDEAPRSTGEFARPIVFSQTEIETIGLQGDGRLQLIDSFLRGRRSNLSAEQQAIAEFASINVEVEKERRELEELERQVATAGAINLEIANISVAEQSLTQTSQVINEKKVILDTFAKQITEKGVLTADGERILTNLGAWYTAVKKTIESAPTIAVSSQIPAFSSVLSEVEEAKKHINTALEAIANTYHKVKRTLDAAAAEKISYEEKARHVRQELDGLSEGAGQILRKGQQLREQQAKLLAVEKYTATRKHVLSELLAKRNQVLDKLDLIRSQRFLDRQEIVQDLNRRLGPKIRIELTRNAQVHGFAAAISDVLRGSNLRFSEIARALAEKLSPRALLNAVDTFDQQLIAQVADISIERAARVLSHLRATDLGKIGCIDVDDNVNFQLLDGKDYKDFSALSTGQRCTVVLPMVLAHKQKIVIVDQPEDHIDNAFIADTLIKAILARDSDSQIIFSTHNPNIPVLGNADRVFQMGSDGRRGFKLAGGELDDLAIVTAISNVMEGGAEAFSRRSSFYEKIS